MAVTLGSPTDEEVNVATPRDERRTTSVGASGTSRETVGQHCVNRGPDAPVRARIVATVARVDTDDLTPPHASRRAAGPRPRVLVVAGFDSQLKWSAGISQELERRGADVEVVAPAGRSALSDQQVRDVGFDHVRTLAWDDVVDAAAGADVVVCALAGPQVRRLTIALGERRLDPGPVVVAGWVGIIIEKITAGYLDRSAADVVAVNARHELDHFRYTAHRLSIPDENLVLSGLPFLSPTPAAQPAPGTPVRTVLFADQPTVPSGPGDRTYLYRRLVEHARRHPDREVLLKPRHRLGEDTFHRMHHHPEQLLAGVDLPPNFHVVYTPITELLPRTDLLLTVSSTACLEAVDAGARVALVLDLGVHERLGNHVFLDSGLLRTFDQVDDDDLGTPAPDWVDSYFGGRNAPAPTTIADRVEKLLASGERPSALVRESPYYRAAVELESARGSALVRSPGPWARRRHRYGTVRGTVVHAGTQLLPPVLMRPVRSLYRRALGRI
jgi:hypothetical protein